jgi:hypothetical protein
MPSNFYERKNEYRLYDVEGVLLTAGNYIIIREPSGFSEFPINLERDPQKHGLFYEFGGEDETLGFDRVTLTGQPYSPFNFIRSIVQEKGIDAKIQFELLNYESGVPVSQYLADLDFEQYSEEDYKISVNSRRVLLGDKFRTRVETQVDFSKTESIDGTPITGLTPDSMYFHGKIIDKEGDLEVQDPLQDADFPAASFDNPANFEESINGSTTTISEFVYECAMPFFKTNINSIEGLAALNAAILVGDDALIDNNIFTLGGEEFIGGAYDFDISLEFCFRNKYVLAPNVNIDLDISAELVVVNSNNEEYQRIQFFIDSYSFNKPASDEFERYYPNNGVDRFFDGFYTATYNNSLNLNDKDRVFIFVKAESSIGINGGAFFFSDGQILIDAKQVQEGSQVDTYKLFEATNHVIESITDQTSVLESNFLQNIADPIRITNGYKIRDFQPGDSNVNTEVKTNFKSHFENFLQPVFGLGYSIYENGGVFKVLMERYEDFYQDIEVDFIDTIQDGTYFVEYDKDLIYNESRVGYKDFPKSTDENKSNNIDETNTQHSLLTPIESVKKKADYISEYIASGYKIENQRREQFKDKPSDTVSDDDKLFTVVSVETNQYTDLTVNFIGNFPLVGNLKTALFTNGTYLDIQVGDQVTVSGSVSNDGVYNVIETIILGVDLSVRFQENVTTELGVSGVTITLDSTRLRAARDDEFQSITNVVDAKTVYNVGLNPRYMLKNHSLLLNSGFNPKPETDTIKTQDVKLNSQMSCQFKVGEGLYNVNPEVSVSMNEDTVLSTFNNYEKLFSGFLIKFTANISYQRVVDIRNNYLNQGSENYGFIRIETPQGEERSGYLMNMTYNPLSQQAEFVLREKFTPTGGGFDYVLDFPLN